MTDLTTLPSVWERHEDDMKTGLPAWLESITSDHEWCSMVPDGIDTDGSEWNRCVVHDQLVFGDAYLCEGYVAPQYAEVDSGEPTLVLLAPVNGTGDLYGWYFDSNPSFVFDHETLATVLTMEAAAALEWLRGKVSTEAQHRGIPWYV